MRRISARPGISSLLVILVGLTVVSACTDGGWPPPSTESTTTVPSSTSTVPGSGCDDYTPSQLAISQVAVAPGGQVTITGIVGPNDSVVAALAGGTIGSVNLGTATADGAGQFSITATIPSPLASGTYSINVTSTLCQTPGSLSITVTNGTPGSCSGNRASRTFRPGQTVDWKLDSSNFSTNHNVQLKISKQGYSSVIYNGAWPASGTVRTTIPSSAPGGEYTIVQSGRKAGQNGTTTSKSCSLWVELRSVVAPGPGASVEGASLVRPDGRVLSAELASSGPVTQSSGAQRSATGTLPFTGGDAVSMTVIAGAMLLAGLSLLRLRRRQTA